MMNNEQTATGVN